MEFYKVPQTSFDDSFAHDGQSELLVQLTEFEKGLITDVVSGDHSLKNEEQQQKAVKILRGLMHLIKTNSLTREKKIEIITTFKSIHGIKFNEARRTINKTIKYFRESLEDNIREQVVNTTTTVNSTPALREAFYPGSQMSTTKDPSVWNVAQGIRDISAVSKKAREGYVKQSSESITSVQLSPEYFAEFKKTVIANNRALGNNHSAQQMFHTLIKESVIALSNVQQEQQGRYMSNIISQHTDTLTTTGLSQREAAGIAAYIAYMTFFTQTDIARQQRQQNTTTSSTPGSLLDPSLKANYNSDEGGGDDFDSKLNAIGQMSDAKEFALLLLYRKLTGEDVQSLTKAQQKKMKNKMNGWIHLRSPLLKSVVYLTRSLVPTLLTTGTGLLASTAAIGVLPHATLAILVYIVAEIGVGALTHKTLNEIALVSGTRHVFNHLDKKGFMPPELKPWYKAIFKYMRSDIGKETPKRYKDTITRGVLRDMAESGENAELRKQKYIHIFSRLAFGVSITGLHWIQFGDKWTDMFTAWLAHLNTPTIPEVTNIPFDTSPSLSDRLDGGLNALFGNTTPSVESGTVLGAPDICLSQGDKHYTKLTGGINAMNHGGVKGALAIINHK